MISEIKAREEFANYDERQAISYLKRKRDSIGSPNVDACNIAIQAIEKQMPKAIMIKGDGVGHCPNCEMDIHGRGQMKFCTYCGQAINWDISTRR